MAPTSPRPRFARIFPSTLVAAVLALGLVVQAAASATSMGIIGSTSSVNIRACAALDCPAIGSATLGDAIEVTGDPIDGFYPVLWYDREGFVYQLYVTLGGQAPWLTEGTGSCNRVALVFNIGIGEEPSQSVIDTLVESDVAASMFPMGWWAREQPEYLRSLDEAGFLIGTHGDQQRFLTSLSTEAIVSDVLASERAIESVIGREMDEYFTPYAADTDSRVRATVSAEGLLPVGWGVAANDYGPEATEGAVYDLVMDGVYPGAIVEMHLDGPATESSTARALPRLIADLRAMEYEFVTVSDMALPCDA